MESNEYLKNMAKNMMKNWNRKKRKVYRKKGNNDLNAS